MINLMCALLMLFYFESVSAGEPASAEASHPLADMSGNNGLGCQRDCRNEVFRTGSSTSSPYSVQDDGYSSCIENAAGIHFEMIGCIDAYIDKHWAETNSKLGAATKNPLIAKLSLALKSSEKSWIAYMNAKCDLYLSLAGQRSELLNRTCILDEVISRHAFVSELLVEAQF